MKGATRDELYENNMAIESRTYSMFWCDFEAVVEVPVDQELRKFLREWFRTFGSNFAI
jgi:hypothetical protein